MSAPLPAGTTGLPPLGGGPFALFRALWWALLIAALAAVAWSWTDGTTPPTILALRLAKSAVLIAVATILFRRRPRDSVAALLGLSFLLWTISSSVNFAIPADAGWPVLIDRMRFLSFALALLLFPDGEWRPRWTRAIAAGVGATFVLGCAEASRIIATTFYLPIAIGCVLAALAALVLRYRETQGGPQKQQLKWVSLGLFAGIGLILFARAAAWLARDSAMPFVGTVAIEGAFQLGIIILAVGFLVSLLRFRLYDAEAAISRSAIYAALTLSVVGIFAAGESLIELLGQRYFGSSIGSISGAVAAALAAVLLTPLHTRLSMWAEQYFQHDLAEFKRELPDLLLAHSAGSSVKRLAEVVLPRIEQAVQSTRIALILDNRLVATRGIALPTARKLLRHWHPPGDAGPVSQTARDPFPLHMPLRCPLGGTRGWLLLGPRPDGSLYGADDQQALAEVGPALQRTMILVAEREMELARQQGATKALDQAIAMLSMRLEHIERLSMSERTIQQ